GPRGERFGQEQRQHIAVAGLDHARDRPPIDLEHAGERDAMALRVTQRRARDLDLDGEIFAARKVLRVLRFEDAAELAHGRSVVRVGAPDTHARPFSARHALGPGSRRRSRDGGPPELLVTRRQQLREALGELLGRVVQRIHLTRRRLDAAALLALRDDHLLRRGVGLPLLERLRLIRIDAIHEVVLRLPDLGTDLVELLREFLRKHRERVDLGLALRLGLGLGTLLLLALALALLRSGALLLFGFGLRRLFLRLALLGRVVTRDETQRERRGQDERTEERRDGG